MLPGWPLALLLQTAPAAPMPPAVVKAQASVLLVRGRAGSDHGRQGSGVVIAPHLVATNAHVVEGASGLTVSRGMATWPVTQVQMDPSRDLCLLTVPELPVPPVEMAEEPTELGQDIVVVGYPGGHGPVATKGRLRGIWHHGDGRLLQSDARTLPGNSGGGLFDTSGRLLGLTTLTFTSSPRLNYSVPVAWVQELALQPAGEVTPRASSGLEHQGVDLIERLAADPRNWPTWESAARQWLRDLPDDEMAWLALGLALNRSALISAESHPESFSKLLTEAALAYRRSLDLNQGANKNAKAFNNLGVALDLLNRFDEAEKVLAEAVSMEPDYAMAWLNLASSRFNAHRFSAAAEAFQRGLTLRPDEANAWIRLAHCQWLLNQKAAAVATMEIGLRYRPLMAEHWLDFGLWQVDLGHLDEARDVHTRLVTMDPEVAARLQASLNRAQTIGAPARKTKLSH